MDPTRSLRDEHQVILAVLECFGIAVGRARAEQQLDQNVFASFIEFFRGFADRCHHCKEEDRLFPCLERCGMSREEGPIRVMLDEHQQGRAHIAAIAAALPAAATGDAVALQSLVEEGRRFTELLRHHIMKEDHVLFNMADAAVQGPSRTQLFNEYAQAEESSGYRTTLDSCYEVAARLCGDYGVPLPAKP
jgi:hemerythrin-like domain-containing protein